MVFLNSFTLSCYLTILDRGLETSFFIEINIHTNTSDFMKEEQWDLEISIHFFVLTNFMIKFYFFS